MKYPLITAALACVLSPAVYSATISHAGYSLDTDTDIVTGGGLEWLQWDETLGMSINQATSAFGSDGWRLATLGEMVSLFNVFDFGTTFIAVENNTFQEATGAAASGLLNTPNYDIFVTIFGETFFSGSSSSLDPQRRAQAHFGLDENNNGLHGRVQVAGDYQQNNGVNRDAEAWLYGEISTSGAGSQISSSGVALVRAPSAVPVPAAAWLFGSALIGLVGLKRKRGDT